MNVKELIEKLQDYDQELIVSVDGHEGGVTDSITIEVTPVRLNANAKDDPWSYGEHEDWVGVQDGTRLVLGKGTRGEK